MSRTSYKEICRIYKRLDDKFPKIRKEHLIQIICILNTRDKEIPVLSRNEKRKKKLIIDYLNKNEAKIQRYISLIVPVDKSSRKISTVNGKNEISWKFLDESEPPSIHDEAEATNILDQNYITNIPDQNVNPNTLNQNLITNIPDQNVNPNILDQNLITNIPDQNVNPNILDQNLITNIPDQNVNPTIQDEFGATSNLDQSLQDQPEDLFLILDDDSLCSGDLDPFSSSLLGMNFEW